MDKEPKTQKPKDKDNVKKFYAQWWFWTITILTIIIFILGITMIATLSRNCNCSECINNEDAINSNNLKTTPTNDNAISFNGAGSFVSGDFYLTKGSYIIDYGYDNFDVSYATARFEIIIDCEHSHKIVEGKKGASSYSGTNEIEIWREQEICDVSVPEYGSNSNTRWDIKITKQQ